MPRLEFQSCERRNRKALSIQEAPITSLFTFPDAGVESLKDLLGLPP